MSNAAVGVGLVTRSLVSDAQPVLDVRFAALRLGDWDDTALSDSFRAPGAHVLSGAEVGVAGALAGFSRLGELAGEDPDRRTSTSVVSVVIADLSAPPVDAVDVYLRLHLLSHRLVAPHGQNLDGVFGLLHNVVWTSLGPCDSDGFASTRLGLLAKYGPRFNVFGVDKFPRMVDYVIPSGVRIADADRVRLGAHLAEGTTVMHEGFCNFNAGTLGPAMIEGRISAGVVVGANSDLGGSASVMGTLSGGGKEVIRVGERCLVGANAGIGISLGDDCIVEAGLYITAGTPVTMVPGADAPIKARDLSGQSGLLFRRNGQNGRVEVVLREGVKWDGLNTVLHKN